MAATVLRVSLRGVKVLPPFVEFFPDLVEPPSMICCGEKLPIGHRKNRSELERPELMSCPTPL
jgi:hypothetical protein